MMRRSPIVFVLSVLPESLKDHTRGIIHSSMSSRLEPRIDGCRLEEVGG